MITLRPYQSSLVQAVRSDIATYKSIFVLLSTGGGKTAVAAYIAAQAAAKKKRIIFCVHRDFLLEQTAAAFDRVGVEYTFIAPGYTTNRHCSVVIASIDTLKRRIIETPAPDLLVVDEAIHAAAAGWAKVIEHYQSLGSYTLGLGACTQRLSGQGLGKWFKKIVEGPSMAWLIENGFLSKYKMYSPTIPDIGQLHHSGGDYVKKEAEAMMNRPSITGNVVSHYTKLAPGKRAVAFCCSIKHSLDVRDGFIAAGYRAVHIGSDTSKADRKEMLSDFQQGRINVLTSVDIFSEGFDLPVLEYGALVRPTESLNTYLQQCGRVLRTAPGKDLAIIADHAGNCGKRDKYGNFVEHHGKPDKIRDWTLEDQEKKKGGAGVKSLPIKQCPNCYYVSKPALKCEGCGMVFPIAHREITEIDGELLEIQEIQARQEARRRQSNAKTQDQLIREFIAQGSTPINALKRAKIILAARKKKGA